MSASQDDVSMNLTSGQRETGGNSLKGISVMRQIMSSLAMDTKCEYDEGHEGRDSKEEHDHQRLKSNQVPRQFQPLQACYWIQPL